MATSGDTGSWSGYDQIDNAWGSYVNDVWTQPEGEQEQNPQSEEPDDGEDDDDDDLEEEAATEEAAMSVLAAGLRLGRKKPGAAKKGKKQNFRGFVPPGAGTGKGGPMYNPAHKGPCNDCVKAGIEGK